MRHFKAPYWQAQATVNGVVKTVSVTVRQAPTKEAAARVFQAQFGTQPTSIVRV